MFRVLALICVLTAVGVLGPDTLSARQGPPRVATHVVLFHDGVNPGQAADDLSRGLGLETESVYSHALNGAAMVVPEGRLNALARDPRVKSIEPNALFTIAAQNVPTGVNRISAPGNPGIDIDGTDDFRVDVDVAVIDTGVDLDHPDLNVVGAVDCTGGSPSSSSCTSGGDDANGHGTHVAGTIGAFDNAAGVVGVAPGSRIWSVRVLNSSGSGYLSWIIAGIDWVSANSATIEVANMSLGCECTSAGMDAAISSSVAQGVVYAVAAGNYDKDASTFSPANHPDVITVSALADFNGLAGGGAAPTCRADQDDTLADFSNWGSQVEVAAPGACILSTWMGGGYATISGTSMASPHVAGAAALLASKSNPANKTDALGVRAAIVNTGNLNWTDDSGDGIKERLLDVSSTSVFAPRLIPGGSSLPTGTLTAELAGSATGAGSKWTARVTITVRDLNGNAVGGATVSGRWNGGGLTNCATNSNGQCTVSVSVAKRVANVTYRIEDVTRAGSSYDQGDPSIVVSKP